MTTETIVDIDLKREYTAEEFIQLEDDGNRYELIEGKLVMSPAPTNEHAKISDDLLMELKLFLKANPGLGEVRSHAGFNIGQKPNGKDNVPEPDLGFIIASRVPTTDDNYLPYPDLVVEVWSRTSDLDRPSRLRKAREKLRMYLDAGTSIAWGINPIREEVEVYYRDPTKPKRILKADDELNGEDIIPGFKLSVRALFA